MSDTGWRDLAEAMTPQAAQAETPAPKDTGPPSPRAGHPLLPAGMPAAGTTWLHKGTERVRVVGAVLRLEPFPDRGSFPWEWHVCYAHGAAGCWYARTLEDFLSCFSQER